MFQLSMIHFDSFGLFTRAMNRFNCSSHQNHNGLLYKTENNQKMDEVDMYLKSTVGNKTCKCLLLFVSDKAAFYCVYSL